MSFSPVTGGEGNIEFLFHLTADDHPTTLFDDDSYNKLIEEAYQELL